jgi:hypothetical protein
MKKLLGIFMTVWIVASCATIHTASGFEFGPDKIGSKKEEIIKEFGRPFMYDTYVEGGKTIEVLYYKEPVRVANCPYVITTTLYFENAVLQKFTQKDKLIKDIEFLTDSIK